jgi:heme A synthase
MIQRIQSLWFLLASLASALIFFYPVIEINTENKLFIWQFESISIAGIDNLIQSGFIVAGLTLIIAFLSFVSIFLFKNRILQIRISTVISLLVIFTAALIGIFTLSLKENGILSLGLSSILPLIVFILIMMARRAVKKDEKLVKSVDRIR